jgi:hypothetical protein
LRKLQQGTEKMKQKAKQGRKTLLNGTLQTQICNLLAKGSAIKSACIICQVSERVFYNWRDRGKSGEEPFARFFFAVTRAREQHKANLIQRIVSAMKADWKAAAWLLERQFPADFSRPEQREIIIERPPPPPIQLQPPEVRRETRWTKGEIPFSKAQLKYLSDLSIANHGANADGK